MIILDSLMMTLILFMSVIFCVEDIKNKKIYNKLVVPICAIGIVLHIIFIINISFVLRLFSPLKHNHKDSPIIYINEIEKTIIKI